MDSVSGVVWCGGKERTNAVCWCRKEERDASRREESGALTWLVRFCALCSALSTSRVSTETLLSALINVEKQPFDMDALRSREVTVG